jgi:hypothetical protein
MTNEERYKDAIKRMTGILELYVKEVRRGNDPGLRIVDGVIEVGKWALGEEDGGE